jgi:quercetin dioxygenase-like cupin family protein
MPILRHATTPSDTSDAGVDARRLVNEAMGSKTITMGISTFQPGAGIFLHTHPCEEAVVILAGEAMAELDGEVYSLSTFDTSFVPPLVPHRFWNASDAPMTICYFYPMTAGLTRDPVDPADAPDGGAAHY